MSDVLLTQASTQSSYLMVPVKPVEADLLTELNQTIYVPLATKNTYGSVKIGDGLNIDNGIISFDESEVSILSISLNGEPLPIDGDKNVDIALSKNDVGLDQVDNTSDMDKPISTAQQTALNLKLDKKQSLSDIGKVAYVNDNGDIDFKNVDTIEVKLNDDTINANTGIFNFSNNFTITSIDDGQVDIDLSEEFKESVGKIDSISVNDDVLEIDKNKNVNININDYIYKYLYRGISVAPTISIGGSQRYGGNGIQFGDYAGYVKHGSYNILIGDYTNAGMEGIAIGHHATTTVDFSIQLGFGTNSNQNTFQVWDYQLLDGNTGKIPNERLNFNIDDKADKINLDRNVMNSQSISLNGDNATLVNSFINLNTLTTTTSSNLFPLANDTTAGLMSFEDYQSIRDLQSRVGQLEQKATRLLYDDKLYPTEDEINSFVISMGYSAPFEGVAVVVSGTNHIWHYYENGGWKDDGVDVVSQFTNDIAGIIKGSASDGKVYAETDGTGSVYGWDSLKNSVTNLSNQFVNYTPTSSLASVALSGNYSDLNGLPTLFSGNYNDLTNKPNLATVATSGSYNDLLNLPDLSAYVLKSNTDGYATGTIDNFVTSSGIVMYVNGEQQYGNTINLTMRSGFTPAMSFGASSSDYSVGFNLDSEKSIFSGSLYNLRNTRWFGELSPEVTDDDMVVIKSDLDDYTTTSNLAAVAISNSYNDLDDKPIIPERAKLYSTIGQNTDGAMTQKATTDALPQAVTVTLTESQDFNDISLTNEQFDLLSSNPENYLIIETINNYINVDLKYHRSQYASMSMEGVSQEMLTFECINSTANALYTQRIDSLTIIRQTQNGESIIAVQDDILDFTTFVPNNRTINGKTLANNITLTATDVNALPDTTEIPTTTSQLTNDSNFVSDSAYVHTDNNYTTSEKNKLAGIETGAEVNTVTSVAGKTGTVVLTATDVGALPDSTFVSTININGQPQSTINFDSDPQTQIDNLNNNKFDKTGGTVNGNVTINGSLNGSVVKFGDAELDGTNQGGSIELGSLSKISSPFIDFHTDGNPNTDYNVRLLATSSELRITAGSGVSINGSDIITHGSNSNGYYIQFYNGTQICIGTVTSEGTNTYASPFTANPVIVCGIINSSASNQISYRTMSAYNITSTNFYAQLTGSSLKTYIAIGKYK